MFNDIEKLNDNELEAVSGGDGSDVGVTICGTYKQKGENCFYPEGRVSPYIDPEYAKVNNNFDGKIYFNIGRKTSADNVIHFLSCNGAIEKEKFANLFDISNPVLNAEWD